MRRYQSKVTALKEFERVKGRNAIWETTLKDAERMVDYYLKSIESRAQTVAAMKMLLVDAAEEEEAEDDLL